MFKIFTRSCQLSWQLTNARNTLQRLQNYASFQLRDILHERNDETGTLLINFAKYIATERHRNEAPTPTKIRYADYFPVSDERYFRKELNKTAADQLAALFIFASTYRSNALPDKFAQVLNSLDEVALRQLPNMTPAHALNTLYGLLFLAPHWLKRMDFYYAAMERLTDEFRGDEPKEHFVQLCFYLALVKNRSNQLVKYLQQLLAQHLDTYLPQLNTMDLAIVGNAAYKTSTLVNSAAYEQHLTKVLTEMNLADNTCALLVTVIKAMRIQRMRSPEVCKHLAAIVATKAELNKFDARGLSHMYAYFAENLWDDATTMATLLTAFLERLNDQSQYQQLRAKDVATFVWCCAQLDAKLTLPQLQAFERKLLQQASNDEFKYFSDQLVDACLSLWMLGHKSRALLRAAITHKENAKRTSKAQPKIDSRYTVLQTAAAIEEPAWLGSQSEMHNAFNIQAQAPGYISKRYKELIELGERLAQYEGISSARLVMPITGINIPSLLLEFVGRPEKVFIEYSKPQQLLHFTGQCASVLRLKIRLLDALGHRVLVLRQEDLGDERAVRDMLATLNCDQTIQQSVGHV